MEITLLRKCDVLMIIYMIKYVYRFYFVQAIIIMYLFMYSTTEDDTILIVLRVCVSLPV